MLHFKPEWCCFLFRILHVEVHYYETPASTYQSSPLAAISQDDLPVERFW